MASTQQPPQPTAEELARRQAEKIEEVMNAIHYSDKYTDDVYEYRHVILPKQLFKMKIIPETFWNADQSALRLLSEKEWRSIGITQSLGWEHYEIHAPEPHILLFRREKDFIPPAQPPVAPASGSPQYVVDVLRKAEAIVHERNASRARARDLISFALVSTQFSAIRTALYKHDLLLFRDVTITPEEQYRLNKAFDPVCDNFGHGNNAIDANKKSILHPDLKTIPRVPQVQLIGNGTILNHEGIPAAKLAHPSHTTFHKTSATAPGTTHFFRWHIDAALSSQTLAPPKVTTLYGVHVPVGERQRCVYDDDTGDELDVSLGTTAFVSGKTMFDILPPKLKSLAVRTKVKYAPHPYVWMAKARAVSTGLGLESEGREIEMKDLPSWDEDQIQTLPMLWKNEVTGELHLQVHPCAARELLVDPLPLRASTENALYPEGAHLTNLKVVRELLYEMQRPGISPERVYAHEWKPNDLVLFHNRGVLHSVVGTLAPDQTRAFHQCNLAASDFPTGPSEEATHHWTS